MRLSFYKYHAAGNDFIIFNAMDQPLPQGWEQHIPRWCHRHYGIGADGVLALLPHPTLDFQLLYYNADGSPGVCGNGTCCAVHLAYEHMHRQKVKFLSATGQHTATVAQQTVTLAMPDVANITLVGADFFIDTGAPHYLQWVEDLQQLNVVQLGAKLCQNFVLQPGQTNVTFVKKHTHNSVHIRIYEKGVYAETLSCGTGATAAALLVAATQSTPGPVTVHMPGGTVEVCFQTNNTGFKEITLKGSVEQVFTGTWSL